MLENRFAALGTGSIPAMLLTVFGCALVICLAVMAADWLISKAMQLLRIDRLLKKLDALLK